MAADHAEADFQAAMALLAENFQSPDWDRVAGLIDGAAAAGHAEAIERRALLECRGVFRNADWDVALNSLAIAADRGSRFAAPVIALTICRPFPKIFGMTAPSNCSGERVPPDGAGAGPRL